MAATAADQNLSRQSTLKRSEKSSNGRGSAKQLWLDAWADPVAGLRAFGNCIHTCNLYGDGDWRLVIADADKKIKVTSLSPLQCWCFLPQLRSVQQCWATNGLCICVLRCGQRSLRGSCDCCVGLERHHKGVGAHTAGCARCHHQLHHRQCCTPPAHASSSSRPLHIHVPQPAAILQICAACWGHQSCRGCCVVSLASMRYAG